MSEVDAMDIWREIQQSGLCKKAVKFYHQNKRLKPEILKRGAANFDEPVLPNCSEEKALYRAAYYMSSNGYMDMHINHNQAAFKKYLPKRLLENKKILFVDMGCGPMTAGLVLAEILAKTNPNYKKRVTYLGIDASGNMCKLARRINKSKSIFKDDKFKILKSKTFESSMVDSFAPPDIAILCLSFVLAPGTLKIKKPEQKNMVESMANEWHKSLGAWNKCQETRVIYLNPEPGMFHENWNMMAERLKKTPDDTWRYKRNQNSASVQCITGKRQD